MPEGIFFAAHDTRSFDRPISTIEVNTGQVIVSRRTEDLKTPAPFVVDEGDFEELDGVSAYDVYSFRGASVTVIFAADADEEAEPRGDGDGNSNTGSYESRTKEELVDLAHERGVEGVSKMNKKEVIAALREQS